jgi:hypothetical protein
LRKDYRGSEDNRIQRNSRAEFRRLQMKIRIGVCEDFMCGLEELTGEI